MLFMTACVYEGMVLESRMEELPAGLPAFFICMSKASRYSACLDFCCVLIFLQQKILWQNQQQSNKKNKYQTGCGFKSLSHDKNFKRQRFRETHQNLLLVINSIHEFYNFSTTQTPQQWQFNNFPKKYKWRINILLVQQKRFNYLLFLFPYCIILDSFTHSLLFASCSYSVSTDWLLAFT